MPSFSKKDYVTSWTRIGQQLIQLTHIWSALIVSKIASYYEIDLKVNKVGVWNKAVKLSETVQDLDRIEVYRPLIADPKEVRKLRAEKAKEEGRADKTTGGRVNPLSKK